jgi:enoyl-CoA hydratase
VTFPVPPDEFETSVEETIGRLAGRSRDALATVKAMLSEVGEGPHDAAIRAERALFLRHALHSEDVAEGLAAFQERRPPRFPTLDGKPPRRGA